MSGVISDNTVRSSGAVAPLSSSTLDASNPAVDTNPTDGLGTKWVNTTSGQIFICTDATTDANQWIGQKGTALVGPRCIWAGGNSDDGSEHTSSGTINEISYVVPTTLGDATDFGDLLAVTHYFAGTSNGTNERGVFGGGSAPGDDSNVIQYITCSSASNATDFGNLIDGLTGAGACSNGTSDRGMWSGGGITGPDNATNQIDYITISTPGNAADFGNITLAVEQTCGLDNGTNDRGINAAGILDGGVSGTTDRINYWTISTTADAQDFGNLTAARDAPATCSNDTNDRGLFMAGGYAGSSLSYSNHIDYITITSTGNATNFGDCAGAVPGAGYPDNDGGRGHPAGTSSGTAERGLMGGGYTYTSGPVESWYKQIEYVTISTTGNSTSFGNLAKRVYGPAALNNTFG